MKPHEGDSLYSTLRALFPAVMTGRPVIAAVGGGGKTGTLFALAASLSGAGRDAALTTTTHIRDPRHETGRRFDEVIIDAALALPESGGAFAGEGGEAREAHGGARRGVVKVVASATESGSMGPRLLGIHPSRVRGLLRLSGAVLVEADGSRMLPIKAPADHEPALPREVDVVLGLVGLDCLGRPMDGETVHRPELFGGLTGCGRGQAISAEMIRALAAAPSGLFKGAPPGALRVLVLNKADRLGRAEIDSVERAFAGDAPRGVDAVLLYSASSDTAQSLGSRSA